MTHHFTGIIYARNLRTGRFISARDDWRQHEDIAAKVERWRASARRVKNRNADLSGRPAVGTCIARDANAISNPADQHRS